MAKKGKAQNVDYTPKDFSHIEKELTEAEVLISLGKLD